MLHVSADIFQLLETPSLYSETWVRLMPSYMELSYAKYTAVSSAELQVTNSGRGIVGTRPPVHDCG